MRLHPMQPVDFEARAEIPHSGWPFAYDHLQPFFLRAQEICRAGPYSYQPDHWASGTSLLPLELPPELVDTIVFQLAPGARFDHRIGEYAAHSSLRILLRTTALELCATDSGTSVERTRAANAAGRRFDVRADAYVLACGGIENARLLLLSSSTQVNGIGNAHGLVGRFFMEHPHMRTGVVRLRKPLPMDRLALYRITRRGNVSVEGTLRPSPAVVRQHGLLNSSWWIFPRDDVLTSDVARTLVDLREVVEYRRPTPGTGRRLLRVLREPAGAARALWRAQRRRGDVPATTLLLAVTSEQSPNPDSRVTLGDRRDVFGRRKARLDWRLTSLDMESIGRTQHLLGRAFQQAGIGTLDRRFNEGELPSNLGGGAHHMGTTRMHDSPLRGVVDRTCRVHGVANLYVAGSSVFPTGGYANPQLTLLALAVRLADHLKQRMRA